MTGSSLEEGPVFTLSSRDCAEVEIDKYSPEVVVSSKDRMTGSSSQDGPGAILSSEDSGSDENIV